MFSGSQVNISYLGYAFEPISSAEMYPTAYKLTADNGEYQFNLNIKMLKEVPLQTTYPRPMPGYYIYEQVSLFNGTLSSGNKSLYQFQEIGFTEYTTHKLYPLVGRIVSPDPSNVRIEATNLRTGEVKSARSDPSGFFSIDGNFTDYLANSTAPWITNGDTLTIQAMDDSGRQNSTSVTINIKGDRQNMGEMELK